jgi:hypothetical protein
MTSSEKRPSRAGESAMHSDPQVEFEKILSRLGASRETIKEVERTVEAPDATTKITYGVEVDPRTGAQKVTEKFSTTMKQCSICSNYVSRIFRCEVPGCANDKRVTGWYFPNGRRNVCLSCYEAARKEAEIFRQGM